MRPLPLLTCAVLLLAAPPAARADDLPAAARAAIGKSLPLLEQSAATYITKRTCFSCHHQSLPAMTVALARTRGLTVDDAAAKAQSTHTRDAFAEKGEQMRQGTGVPGGPYTAGYALVGLAADRWPADAATDDLVQYLLATQAADGHWPMRSRRPPLEYTTFTSTALGVAGLNHYPGDRKDEVARRTDRARAWLLDNKPKDTEDRVFRLFGLKWAGADAAAVKAAADDLLAGQRDDGGWGQTADMDTDAYATGSALVALHLADGLATTAAAYRRGVATLLKAQLADGSWRVTSRSKPFQTYFESGFPHKEAQWISICATSWATMALIEVLPEAPAGPKGGEPGKP
jgi:hypothetical protein